MLGTKSKYIICVVAVVLFKPLHVQEACKKGLFMGVVGKAIMGSAVL